MNFLQHTCLLATGRAWRAGIFSFTVQPRVPSDGATRPNFLLQQWAWTTAGAAATRAARAADKAASVDASMQAEPVFTVEAALKCFVWSSLMYGVRRLAS